MRVVSTSTAVVEKRSLLDDLVDRLNHGEAMINQLRADNKPIGALEEHWLRLLREYEAEYRARQQAA